MRLVIILVLAALFVPSASALSISVDIGIGANGMVKETFLVAGIDEGYSYYEFVSVAEPVSVDYSNEYKITKNGSVYILELSNPGVLDDGNIMFSVLYDGLVEKTSGGRVFRALFSTYEAESVIMRIALPEGFYLRDGTSILPPADRIRSDGKRIIADWEFGKDDVADVVVFYQGGRSSGWMWWIALLSIAVIASLAVGFHHVSRHRVRKVVSETLSDDENLVVGLIRQKVIKQKEIAAKLGFSKSKMSKVMRKLEEKGLIEKTPYFKTNKIKLKKI